MPLSRADQERVTQARRAAERLREVDSPELASTVDFLLTDEGRKFVNRLAWKDREEEFPNFAFQVPKALRDDIKAEAAVAGANLEAEAEHVIKQFLAGAFTPAQPAKYARGQAPAKVNLNIRVARELRQEADALGKQLLADGELEWAPLASHVLTSYFTDRVEEGFRNPIKKRYRGRELWTSTQAAESLGIDVEEWLAVAPDPLWVAPSEGPMWDPDDVTACAE